MIKTICPVCKKEFYLHLARIKEGRKFCSRKCAEIGKNKYNKKGKEHFNYKPRIERKCLCCSKIFYKRPQELKRKGLHKRPCNFCSRICFLHWQKGKNNPAWRGGEVKRKCLICNKEFYVKRGLFKNGGGKFCSNKCYGKWASKTRTGKANPKIKGENNPNWKGGITSENTLIRISKEYEIWRKAVFERDNYTCKGCGQWGKNLHAHHILPFAQFQHKRFDITNGITLCKKCHNKIHSKKDAKHFNELLTKWQDPTKIKGGK